MGTITCQNCKAKELSEEYIFCPFCGKKLINEGVCKNCGFRNSKSAKFCQECGATLTTIENNKEFQSDVTILETESIPKSGITIEFGYSSSSNYDLAKYEAEMFPSLRVFGEGKKTTYRININNFDIDKTINLVKYIKGWKSSKIFIDGERTTWDDVYAFLWCYEKRASSYKPELYCYGYENNYDLNIWGCLQARLPFTDYAPWSEWGKWLDKNGTWQFDKERIKHELQVALYKYRFCPAIQLDLIEDVLMALPDQVNPKKNNNWKFVESWGDDGIPNGLVIVTTRFGFKDKVIMKGVAPNGVGAIQDILRKMKHKLPKEIIK